MPIIYDDGFDPEQKIYLLKPGYNANAIDQDKDCLESISFQTKVANKLDDDGFIEESFNQLKALYDWGEYDIFDVNKCVKFKDYLLKKLDRKDLDSDLIKVYTQMLEITNKAIEMGTGLLFDFV